MLAARVSVIEQWTAQNLELTGCTYNLRTATNALALLSLWAVPIGIDLLALTHAITLANLIHAIELRMLTVTVCLPILTDAVDLLTLTSTIEVLAVAETITLQMLSRAVDLLGPIHAVDMLTLADTIALRSMLVLPIQRHALDICSTRCARWPQI